LLSVNQANEKAMALSPVLNGLTSKHSELAGELEHLKKEVGRVQDELRVVDAAIKLFDADFDLRTLRAIGKRPANKFFKHGECNKLVIDVLRKAKGTLTTNEIAERTALAKGLDLATIDEGGLRACVLTILSRMRTRGMVIEAGRDAEHAINWQLP
jgi:hypothetical protein